MNKKVTKVYMADLYGYERQTFRAWELSGNEKILTRLDVLKLGAVLIKNGISIKELYDIMDNVSKLEAQLELCKRERDEYELKLNEELDKIESLRGLTKDKK